MMLISFSYRPRGCRHVRIVGLKANLSDYDRQDREDIDKSEKILYPTRLYAQPLSDAGKIVFPSPRHYYYHSDKIRQTTLFTTLGIPHPETRVYFGRQASAATRHFKFPFIAKIPRGVGQGLGVYLIKDEKDWSAYLSLSRIAYVQEYLALERDLRVVVVAGQLVVAYWRVIPPNGFKSNLFQGGSLSFEDVPEDGVAFALDVVRRCRFEDVGLDVCRHKGRWMVIEANMRYGLHGMQAAGISLADVLDNLIETGAVWRFANSDYTGLGGSRLLSN